MNKELRQSDKATRMIYVAAIQLKRDMINMKRIQRRQFLSTPYSLSSEEIQSISNTSNYII